MKILKLRNQSSAKPFRARRTAGHSTFMAATAFILLGHFSAVANVGAETLLKETILLGRDSPREWEEFEGRTPRSTSWNAAFDIEGDPSEGCLLIRQRDVKLQWKILLNDRQIGILEQSEEDLVRLISVPGDALKEGTNTLEIRSPGEQDDIELGPIQWLSVSGSAALNQSRLTVRALNEQGLLTPCRITVVNDEGALMPLSVSDASKAAVRTGVVYSGTGSVDLGLMPGGYRVYVSKGFEYSAPYRDFELTAGDERDLDLILHHEVDAPGWIGVDPHVHTFTHSRHGDATVEERVLTIAGEGLDVSIATDHNYHADYQDVVENLGLADRLLTVTGNEVTTGRGHFNAFPIVAESRVANFRLNHWEAILQSIRQTPNVKTIILNHPRGIHGGFRPFAREHFNPVTGENTQGWEFDVNAMEVANSSAMRSDVMSTFHDWFALLNYGHRIYGVGSSDCHDVSRYILGQGRTYVQSFEDDPAKLDVYRMCDAMNAGRMLVSMGLLVNAVVEERYGVGDLVPAGGRELRVDVVVQSPSWSAADKVVLFANGIPVREVELSATPELIRERISLRLPATKRDYHLIAFASGPGVERPHFKLPKPYQSDSPKWTARSLAAANPIWIDADGDGKYTAPREYARRLVEASDGSLGGILRRLESYDEAAAAQAASLCRDAGIELTSSDSLGRIEGAAPAVKRGFMKYISTL